MKINTSIKSITFAFFIFALGIACGNAQTKNEVGDQRARLFHEAIKSSESSVWKAYVQENYSAEFLEKHELATHIAMLERLHKDFSKSKILSLKKSSTKISMIIEKINDRHQVIIELSLDRMDADKVNGISIEAGELK